MDSLGTWPRPARSDERDVDAQTVARLRTDAAGRPSPGERLGTWLLLLIPLAAVLAVVLLWQQWARSGSVWFPVLVAVVLLGAGLWWAGRLRRTLAAVRERLGRGLAGVVDHGVAVVRDLTLEPAGEDGADAGLVRARLELSVTPVGGPHFRTTVEALYDADAALLLATGSHGPVRFLRHDPEGTTVIDTRLSEEQVQQVYRAAALN